MKRRMKFKKRTLLYQWRDYLTPEEERRVAQIERAPQRTPVMKYEHLTIRNRATARARYALGKR